MTHRLTAHMVLKIQRPLLAWYDQSHRNLPWRGETDPYRVWVSEVMLQQTQVTTVIPYYQGFLEAFPNVERLARASLEDVLRVWQGLGYYARARNLHAAARRIVDEFEGRLPAAYDQLRRLPGFGDYTAGAVASIAFGEVRAAVDGNVRRVLARLLAFTEDGSRGDGRRRIQGAAQALVPASRPGDFNQALMELGATVCTPRTPMCHECPLRQDCQAFGQGIQDRLPEKGRRPEQPLVEMVAGVVRRQDGHVLICKRPTHGLLGGLWQFPGDRMASDEPADIHLARHLERHVGIKVCVETPLTDLSHAYTHFRIRLHVFLCRFEAGEARGAHYVEYHWLPAEELGGYPMAVTDRKIAHLLCQAGHHPT